MRINVFVPEALREQGHGLLLGLEMSGMDSIILGVSPSSFSDTIALLESNEALHGITVVGEYRPATGSPSDIAYARTNWLFLRDPSKHAPENSVQVQVFLCHTTVSPPSQLIWYQGGTMHLLDRKQSPAALASYASHLRASHTAYCALNGVRQSRGWLSFKIPPLFEVSQMLQGILPFSHTISRICPDGHTITAMLHTFVLGFIMKLFSSLIADATYSLIHFCFQFSLDVVDWFTGWPAGVKLNHNVSEMFGTSIGWIFSVFLPFLPKMKTPLCFIIEWTLCFGICFAAVTIADAFWLLIWPIRFIAAILRVIASNLLHITSSLLLMLRGKHRNPLRDRIDDFNDMTLPQLITISILFIVSLSWTPTVIVFTIFFTILLIVIESLIRSIIALTYFVAFFPLWQHVLPTVHMVPRVADLELIRIGHMLSVYKLTTRPVFDNTHMASVLKIFHPLKQRISSLRTL